MATPRPDVLGPTRADDPTGYAHHHAVRRDVLGHHRLSTNGAVVTDSDRTEHDAPGAEQNAVTDRRVTLPMTHRDTAEGHPVEHDHVVADLRCLANNYPDRVVDEESVSNSGPRVNVARGKNPYRGAEDPRGQIEVSAPEGVGDPMAPDRVQPRIRECHIPNGSRRRILVHDSAQVVTKLTTQLAPHVSLQALRKAT